MKEQCLTKIEKMDSSDLEEYRVIISRSNCTNDIKKELYTAIDERMSRVNRSYAMVEESEIRPGEIM